MDKTEQRFRKIERLINTKRSRGSTTIFSSGGGSGSGGGGVLQPSGGGTGTSTTFTQGSIVFAGASGIYTEDNANFFYDDSNNRLYLGHNATIMSGGVNPRIQVGGTNTSGASAQISRWSNDASAAHLFFVKSRSTTVGGGFTAVANNDIIGRIDSYGADGTDFSSLSSAILFEVDGAVSTGIVPGRMRFFTTTTAGSAVERLRFSSAGAWGLSGATYGTAGDVLTSAGSSAPPTWTTPGGISGLTTEGITYATSATTIGTTTGMVWDVSANQMQLAVDNNSNSEHALLRLTHSRTSTIGFGNMGCAIAFRTETSDGNFEIGAQIGVNSYDITAAAEYYSYSFNVMGNGATSIRAILTGAGNFGLGITQPSTGFGTSADTVFGMMNGTAPGSSPTNIFQMYSADIAAGNAAPHFRTELGQIIKLYTANAGSAYSITNGVTDRAYDANATTVAELADALYTLIEDLKLTGLIV